ncbi:MAG: hypothetical protein ACYDD1_03065 [Caulobacteraceae bacterium]
MAAEWVEWHGGHCPVAPQSLVHVKFRDQIDGFEERHDADGLRWDHRGSGGDILAYCLAQADAPAH